jgi:hypothetical protein
MPLTFPDYAMNGKNFVQGPGLAFYAPYVTAGGDAPSNSMVAVGLFTEDGIETGHKITYQHVKSDQSTWATGTFVTDQELKFKLTLQEMSPANLTVGMGLPTGSLAAGPPAVISLGEFFDIISASGVPSTRPEFRQWIMRTPSPGFDQSTTPKGAWMYWRMFMAAVTAHSAPKVGKKHQMTLQIEVEGFADFTIANAKSSVGDVAFAIPGV